MSKENKEQTCPNNNVILLIIKHNYPFSMKSEELKKEISSLIERYQQMYMAPQLKVQLRFNYYEKFRDADIQDVKNLIMDGTSELSRRINEKIIKWTLFVACISAVMCFCQLFK